MLPWSLQSPGSLPPSCLPRQVTEWRSRLIPGSMKPWLGKSQVRCCVYGRHVCWQETEWDSGDTRALGSIALGDCELVHFPFTVGHIWFRRDSSSAPFPDFISLNLHIETFNCPGFQFLTLFPFPFSLFRRWFFPISCHSYSLYITSLLFTFKFYLQTEPLSRIPDSCILVSCIWYFFLNIQ